MNINKEKWIDEVLNSTHGRQAVPIPDGFYEQVVTRLGQPLPPPVAKWPVLKWAAAALLLLGINVATILYSNHQAGKTALTTNANPLFQEFQTESTYNY